MVFLTFKVNKNFEVKSRVPPLFFFDLAVPYNKNFSDAQCKQIQTFYGVFLKNYFFFYTQHQFFFYYSPFPFSTNSLRLLFIPSFLSPIPYLLLPLYLTFCLCLPLTTTTTKTTDTRVTF